MAVAMARVALALAALVACVCAGARAAPACLAELGDFAVSRLDSAFSNYSRVANPAYNVHLPAFVALPRTHDEVLRALRCADAHGLPVSVKAGGHSFAGYSSVPAPGFMINLANMTRVEWTGPSTVRVQAGARWRDVYAAFKEHGGLWVVTGGLCPSVGVAGFTMGGGVGPCARQYGMAIDNVIRFTMATADGAEVVVADNATNRDLFWALRGGGGSNFGVVLDIEFAVHEGPKDYTWGTVCYPPGADATRAALQQLGAVADSLPGTTNVDAVLEPGGGLCLWVVHLGPRDETLAAIAPLTGGGANVTMKGYDCFWEMIQAFAVAHAYEEYDDDPFVSRTAFVESVADIADAMATVAVPDACDQHLIHFGGAIGDVGKGDTAFFWRRTQYMVYASCGYTSDAEKAAGARFLDEWWALIAPHARGSYVNFIDPALPHWKELYYGGNLRRLVEIKQAWNPAGRGPLHFAQEIDAGAQ